MGKEEAEIWQEFKMGEVYVATPALQGQPNKLVAVIGKNGSTLQLAFVDGLAVGKTKVYDGKEFAMIETSIGRYNIFAGVKAAAKEAAIVNEILKNQGKAVEG